MLVNDYEQKVESVTHITGHNDGHGRISDHYIDPGPKTRVKQCKFINLIRNKKICIIFNDTNLVRDGFSGI